MKQTKSKITETPPKEKKEKKKSVDVTEETIIETVKENLKIIRHTRGLSLDKLASRCGVSRAMLSQIEQGKSTPTISVLWKIANGLNVPFSDLIKEKNNDDLHILKYENTKVLYSNSKVFASRALFPFTGSRKTEFYELTLKPGGLDVAEPHQPGTTENIVVVQGKLRLRVGEKVIELDPKDSVYFRADVPHEYSNPTDTETIMYLVMCYSEETM
ncbi:MAG: XRE family transcriptional regulator [Leptospiraceae bacterium]|nr:XRE family transcriptional regulator [Leptospiraceae bacterium]